MADQTMAIFRGYNMELWSSTLETSPHLTGGGWDRTGAAGAP